MSEITVHPGTELETAEVTARESRVGIARHRDERGLVSAEWVLGIIAAAALAGVLLTVVSHGEIEKALLDVVKGIIQSLVGSI